MLIGPVLATLANDAGWEGRGIVRAYHRGGVRDSLPGRRQP